MKKLLRTLGVFFFLSCFAACSSSDSGGDGGGGGDGDGDGGEPTMVDCSGVTPANNGEEGFSCRNDDDCVTMFGLGGTFCCQWESCGFNTFNMETTGSCICVDDCSARPAPNCGPDNICAEGQSCQIDGDTPCQCVPTPSGLT